MTDEQRTLVAELLRQRIVEITKLFESGGYVQPENVPHAMKAQIQLLAKDLGHAFVKSDGAFEQLFVEAVGREINRSEGRSEEQTQEAENNPFEKLWGAAESEDGFVATVDPSDMKNVFQMGRETPAMAQAAGSTGGHAIGQSAVQSACSPGANPIAVWYRLKMLGLCDAELSSYKRDGEFTDAVYRVAAAFPMKLMKIGVTYQGPPFDVDEFLKEVERASAE